jgi:predicted transposase/invertase (TIGR01784 family)
VKEEEEMKILLTNDTLMEKAHNAYKKFTANDRLVELNEARMKRIRDEATRLEGTREEGIEQGMEKGVEKGLEQGVSKAKKEAAKRMLEKGYPVEDIQEITGLSRTQIEALKNR